MTKTHRLPTALTCLLLAGAAYTLNAAPEVFKIDTQHSGISFKIRHLLTKVPGGFNEFEGTIAYDAELPENSSASATIQIKSVDTNNEKRDNHLLNKDFFTEEKFPLMTFKSTAWEKTGENTFNITGDLTIMDTTKSVVLETELLGVMDGEGRMQGTRISGWAATTTIDRRDWGLSYGQGTVGNDVAIEINIEAHAKKQDG